MLINVSLTHLKGDEGGGVYFFDAPQVHRLLDGSVPEAAPYYQWIASKALCASRRGRVDKSSEVSI